jgi:hypothetical protein
VNTSQCRIELLLIKKSYTAYHERINNIMVVFVMKVIHSINQKD